MAFGQRAIKRETEETGGEVDRAWARIRLNLRESAGVRLFDQWLKPMEMLAESTPDTVRLALPSQFMADWVRNHYAERLLLEFRAALPAISAVSIETRVAGPQPVALLVEANAEPARPAATRPALDERLTFDRFVHAPSNRVAANAARALAEPGTPRFSPCSSTRRRAGQDPSDACDRP